MRFSSMLRLILTVCSIFILSSAGAAPLKVAVILDKGGKDDKSFNAAALKGAEEAKDKLKIELKVIESSSDQAFEPSLQKFAQKDFDLIISVGFSQTEAIKKVAKRFPKKQFALVDSDANEPNVKSIRFQEHEGAYLVGMIAALTSKTHKLGFVGGMDIPLINRFRLGFQKGAEAVDPKVTVSSRFVGTTGDAWNNPPHAKTLALSLYKEGVDIIFAAAGASSTGVFDALEDKELLKTIKVTPYAIGVDSNQNGIKPGKILTSMEKRVDVAVFETIKEVNEKKFKGGLRMFGLVDRGVDFSMDKNNEKLISADALKKVNQARQDIISGKIVVPDYFKQKK